MTIPLTPISNAQTFGTWLQRTNDIVTVISTNAVTADSTSGGSVTTGNAFINGIIGTISLFVGNSVTNTVVNSAQISTSWGIGANSSGIYSNTGVYGNSFVAAGINVINSIGAFINTVSANSINISSYFQANATSVNASSITVAGLANVSSLNAVSSVSVGSTAQITPTLLTIGSSTLNSTSLSVGSGSTPLSQISIINTSGNLNFFGTSISSSWGISANTIGFYSNVFYGNTLSVGPVVANVGGLYSSNISANLITTNNISVATLGLNVLTANTLTVGNSSINASINSSSIWLGNSSSTFVAANSGGVYTNGNVTVSGSLYISGNVTSTGTTVGTGNYIPSSNSFSLGNSSFVWSLWALSINASATSTFQANLNVGNTLIIGPATLNSTNYSATSNNTLYVGSVIAANIVSNAQLQANLANYANSVNLTNNLANYTTSTQLTANLANYTNTSQLTSNLANYPTSTQLTNNLANYQTTSGLNANIAAYLPNYGGVLNASSISVVNISSSTILIGNSSSNVVANSSILKIANSTVSWSIGLPTAAQVSNGQYRLDATGAWTQGATISANIITTGTSTQNVDSFSIASNYAAEYLIVVGDNNANNRYITSILLTHDGNNAYITEWGSITTNSNLGVFESTTNSSFCTLNFTPTSTNTTIRYTRTLI